MIDLHTHTTYSDGTQTLEELLTRAEEKKLKYISITDHDSIDAYKQLSKENKNIYHGNLITGVEIYFNQGNTFNELIGYGFDINKISESFIFNREERDRQELEFLDIIYPKLIEKGFKLLSKQEYKEKILTSNTFATSECGREVLFLEDNQSLRDELGIHDWKDFFGKWVNNKESDMFMNPLKYKPGMKTVSKTIRDAKGLVFMAHIFRKTEEEAKYLLDYAVENNLIDGVEVYYKTHTKKQIEYLLDFCKKNNLYTSGGTDSHSSRQELGIVDAGIIPDNLIEDWIEKI